MATKTPNQISINQDSIFDPDTDASLSEQGLRWKSLLTVMDIMDPIEEKNTHGFVRSKYTEGGWEDLVASKGSEEAALKVRDNTEAKLVREEKQARKLFEHATAEDKRVKRGMSPVAAHHITRDAFARFNNKYYPREGMRNEEPMPTSREKKDRLAKAAQNRQQLRSKLEGLIERERH